MAEISTIARPYAKGLFQALEDRHASIEEHKVVLQGLEDVLRVLSEPEVSRLFGDPRLLPDQLIGLVKDALAGGTTPKEVFNLLSVVLDNGRIGAWPAIVDDYRKLINDAEGIAEVHIETAFAMPEEEVNGLLAALAHRFPNKKLVPEVKLNPDLIGGVRITVGDQVLDGSISARLDEMKTALTA
ncbi:MAG: F0F1 ATP synthase subunit delta [Sutterellaceae bacterium]|nr:F0F1 ATP synthase subunit delta [Sutterellaceae bacterium]MDD7442599.1 ATP synthase F1 subunit delta [Sutterellaceae bacterium]MDY2867243.1 ATP synthase F1 subunit delta [Mesosutterella sp.]